MIQLQFYSGMRPENVVEMRGCDLDISGKVWSYRPASHKTEHHGIELVIWLGAKAQRILAPFLKHDLQAYLFSPAEAEKRRWAQRRAERESPMTPSQAARTRKRNPGRPPGDHYSVDSYRRAITRGCVDADVPPWTPNQLRHNAATNLRKQFGIEAARVVLGHTSAAVTEIYAEIDHEKAREIMARVG